MNRLRIGLGFFGVVLLCGCTPSSVVQKANLSNDLTAMIPDGFARGKDETWFARQAVSVPLPNYEKWRIYYEDPFFSVSDFYKSGHDPSPAAYMSAIEEWSQKARSAQGLSDFDDDEVSWEFQVGVLGMLGATRLKSYESKPDEVIGSWSSAFDFAERSMQTGPGIHGLNQTVPLLMSAQVATEVFSKLPVEAKKAETIMGKIQLREIAKQKLQEHLAEDILNRIVIFAGAEDKAVLASAILEPAGEHEVTDLLAKEADSQGGFDGKFAFGLAVKWTDELISALDKDWAEVDKVLAKRESEVNKIWGMNVTEFDAENAKLGGLQKDIKYLEHLVAYDTCRSIVPMIESAVVTQMSLDAARVSLALGRASTAGVHVKIWEDLVAFDRDFEKMSDPLTRGVYELDVAKKVLRTKQKQVASSRYLLDGVIKFGIPLN